MNSNLSLNYLNTLAQPQFTEHLADVFEHSPWVAERAWLMKPFCDVDHLHAAMVAVVEDSKQKEKLMLLNAHPQLAGEEARSNSLTKSSSQEQSGAKLDSLSSDEMAEITRLNALYQRKHGFPFIIAVKNHDKEGIFSEFIRRANNEKELEFESALQQVAMIARFRLNALFDE